MCGRFTLSSPARRLRERFRLSAEPAALVPRYNIAPSQPVLVIPNRTTRLLRPARWGLIPHWAKDAAIGNRMINARAETLAARPAFRDALERKRCLIPADGFYEWRRLDAKRRQPFYARAADGEPLALAGLWDVWHPPGGGEPVGSCTIITTAANEALAAVHERMPVILDAQDYDRWLDPQPQAADALAELLVGCPDEWLEVHPVSTAVNSPDCDGPELTAEIAMRDS